MSETEKRDATPREVWAVSTVLRAVREVGFPIVMALLLFYVVFIDGRENGKKLDRIVTVLEERLPKGVR